MNKLEILETMLVMPDATLARAEALADMAESLDVRAHRHDLAISAIQ